MPELLSPRQFAEAIGVSESSVRRWADSGRIRMTRTSGGHRRISRREALRFVREAQVNVVRPDLLHVPQPRHRRQRTEAFAAMGEELLHALECGQGEVAASLVETMYLQGVSVATICDGPMRYAMGKLGDRWPSDPRGIFLEHRATSLCIDALNQLRAALPAPPARGRVAVGGAPERDPYVVPSLMAATVLADAGYRVVNLGPNTPIDVLAASAVELKAQLVWLACTAPLPRAATEKALADAAEWLRPRRVTFVLGGRSASRYRLPQASSVRVLSSMRELGELARSGRRSQE